MRLRNRFITVEGVEGAGKTSAVASIVNWIETQQGGQVVATREPGGTSLGEDLRAILLSHREEGMSSDAELLLMFAARAEHLERVIRPALAAGQWVVCDRFTDASFAYQGGGRGLDKDRIDALAQWTHPDLAPGLTLWLDVPVAVGLARAAGRSTPDRFESEKQTFFDAVRNTYEQRQILEPHRMKRIDAGAPINAVQSQITDALTEAYQNG
ncbi:dTMP kinase [Spiribacter sp. C176]|uniref:Thymidylate kinase n=1 Tax=Spiribacter salilacus TaxID=2664894 RepID=A0A6N7QQ80_9GAMM|nr:dTMP kinase [Spiribacter salilacus]MRH77298.1 dTMP kinase [Spiribacter salilacus]